MIGQQARLGDKVDIDLVGRVAAADIPNLIRFFGVFFPGIAFGLPAICGFKRRAVGTVQRVVAAVAVHEIDRRAAVQVVVVITAEDPVQTGDFLDVGLTIGTDG
ncbi:hypothetical protein Pla52n_68750 [Stieleria varia]|uniref:Uncharacterized protein n=1 Tax=Stieleria varia TaxID=2528005 RepID=A0A5C5ZR17_9BACT|nr:hypothetical protein Pla52n_68750 [Stieleria varia]